MQKERRQVPRDYDDVELFAQYGINSAADIASARRFLAQGFSHLIASRIVLAWQERTQKSIPTSTKSRLATR